MKSIIAVLLLSSFILVSSPPGDARENPLELKEKIQKIGIETVKAYLDGNLELLYSYYTDDAIQMPIYDTMIKGKEAIRNREMDSRKSGVKVDSLYHRTTEVWSCDNLIWEIGTYGVSMTIPGMPEPVTDKGKYLTIWEKQADGAIKIKLEIWNTDMNPFLRSQPGKE